MGWFHHDHSQPSPEAVEALIDAKASAKVTKVMIDESIAVHRRIKQTRESNGFTELIEAALRGNDE